jgi:hypothetical protein
MHVDDARREILMYFHCPSGGSIDSNGRVDINVHEEGVSMRRATSASAFRDSADP